MKFTLELTNRAPANRLQISCMSELHRYNAYLYCRSVCKLPPRDYSLVLSFVAALTKLIDCLSCNLPFLALLYNLIFNIHAKYTHFVQTD